MESENPLLKLQTYGQSIWLDFIRRGMLESGELQALIEEDGLRGVTVNPSILDKAIRQTDDYEEAIDALVGQGKTPREMYEVLAVEDVQRAADLFRPMYDGSEGHHGFVSLEVSPRLAYDTERTVERVRHLWQALDRPNVMIKVPGTEEGLPAIKQLTADGININVTLLFGLPRYRKVADAYIAGLEERMSAGEPVDRIASVASFFLSRINVLIDPWLEEMVDAGGPDAEKADRIRGETAIASAKLAYQIYQKIFEDGRFEDAAEHGAREQRLLWASTSTKNPAYSDIKYVEPLIGPKTVNTLPLRTIDAYRDHGHPEPRLEKEVDKARENLQTLAELGIDLDEATQQLEDEGVEKFVSSYEQLLEALRSSANA
ncbi:MAG: transaldolase [Anaerolineae bacterium]|nr:transaldolase [Anaerolineae bacterium]